LTGAGAWGDVCDIGTVDIKGLPPRERKILIELADGNHEVFPRTIKDGRVLSAQH
jgi:hypothetical protein